MCGLTLSIHPYPISSSHESLLESLCQTCKARGPDTQSTYSTILYLEDGSQIELRLSASVLGLRGEITQQPIAGKRGVLGWNGQVFDGLDVGGGNDTALLAEALEGGADPLELLAGIEGPYAFIYYEYATKKLYYQLDPLSRRSLLICSPPAPDPNAAGPSTVATSMNGFVLTSARSALARDQALEMRALGGGEGGIVDLDRIRTISDSGGGKRSDLSEAITSWTSRAGGEYTHLSPVNTSFPPQEIGPSPSEEVDIFIQTLRGAVMKRVESIPAQSTGVPRVAVLFSGGVDCTLIARLLHDCLPDGEPVDLVNVAFAPSGSETYQTPDRISGIEAYEELRAICERDWRLVLVNVPFEECQSHRQKVLDLMYPSSTGTPFSLCLPYQGEADETEMDLSLAYPLYFASRGQGHRYGKDDAPYEVKAKVYLSGLGADEQLGGYSRHRHAFKTNSWQGLIDETQMDITRLPTRNLSRDDRLISSHARDARYPYLDLNFVSYLSNLPIWVKCNPSYGEGVGDKMILRMATQQLGLVETGKRAKRAMQFGTRSSKMSVSKGPKAGERKVALA